MKDLTDQVQEKDRQIALLQAGRESSLQGDGAEGGVAPGTIEQQAKELKAKEKEIETLRQQLAERDRVRGPAAEETKVREVAHARVGDTVVVRFVPARRSSWTYALLIFIIVCQLLYILM